MQSKSALLVIFTTVFIDLVGFGMIIPLVGIYGRHYGATALELALLGSIYSLMQFFFAPVWGRLSDRAGRRPMILMSLLGSTLSYFLFAFSESFWLLVLSRALAGTFAANISAAQAYIADITTSENRAKGMGLIGAAFGIGFTFGPPIGGLSATYLGLWAPGVIAGTLCGLNLILAYFRLEESLPESIRAQNQASKKSTSRSPLALIDGIRRISGNPGLTLAIVSSFFTVFAFSNLEQVFSLLIQTKFDLSTETAAQKTGLVLMWSGLLGALIQGGLIRKLVPRFGEVRLVVAGLFIQGCAMLMFSYAPTTAAFFLFAIPLAFGSGLLNPSLTALVSKRAAAHEQGAVIGLKEGLSSLARILGPFCGIFVFYENIHAPFWIAGAVVLALALVWLPTLKLPSSP